MKCLNKALLLSALCLSFASVAKAQETPKDYQQVKNKIENVLRFDVLAIGDAPIPNLVQVSTSRGLFYTSQDGTYLISGKIFNVDEGMRDETEKSLSKMRKSGIDEFQDQVIEFKAENEKYVVNVFTDITCGYCRKLHREIEQYNAKGITVRYLAFPRGGIASQAYRDMVSIWCADDSQAAMTRAKAGESVSKQSCDNNVAEQYRFGQQVGVTGTPNIILPNGSMVVGYQPADALLNSIKQG